MLLSFAYNNVVYAYTSLHKLFRKLIGGRNGTNKMNAPITEKGKKEDGGLREFLFYNIYHTHEHRKGLVIRLMRRKLGREKKKVTSCWYSFLFSFNDRFYTMKVICIHCDVFSCLAPLFSPAFSSKLAPFIIYDFFFSISGTVNLIIRIFDMIDHSPKLAFYIRLRKSTLAALEIKKKFEFKF